MFGKIIIIGYGLLLLPGMIIAQDYSDSVQVNSTITVGGMRQTGVLSQTNVNGTLQLEAKKSLWSLLNQTTYAYITANERIISDNWTVLSILKRSLLKAPAISPTLLHVYKNNLQYKILNSHRFSFGASITPFKEKQAFWLFVGAGYEHTLYDDEDFVNSLRVSSTREFAATTVYVENEHQLIAEKLTLKYGLFYIQSWQEASDFTIWIIPGLNLAISKRLALAVSYDYRFRNVHLATVPSFNDVLTANLKISL